MKYFITTLFLTVFAALNGCATVKHESKTNAVLPRCEMPPERRRMAPITQNFLSLMAEVDELISPSADARTGLRLRPNFEAAWPQLEALMNNCGSCNEYEMAQIYQRAAIIRYNLEDKGGAIHYFQKVIGQSPNIPVALEAQITYQIAQLLALQDKSEDGLTYYDQWEALCPQVVPDNYFYFRAQLSYLAGRHDDALREVRQSVQLTRDKGQIPPESWGRLELAILIDRDDFQSALTIAEQLAADYPSPHNVKRVAQIHIINNKESDRDQLNQASSQETHDGTNAETIPSQ